MALSQQDLIHKWAHGLDNGNSGGAVFVSDGILYSYGRHFPLGVRCGEIDGRPAFLLNSRSYSPTTSKHQRWTSAATHHGERLFVPMAERPGHWFVGQMIEQMKREQEAGQLAMLSRGPRKRKDGESAAHRIATTAKRLPLFLKGAGIALDAKQRAALRKLAAWVPADPAALRARLDKEAAAAQRKRERMVKAQAKEEAEALARWIAGEDVRRNFNTTALRAQGDEVCTTKGACVPLSAAVTLWQAWNTGRVKVGQHIGPYTVNEVTPDALTIGCHVIPREAAQDLATRQGW